MGKLLSEFKEFALKGNVVDMAVGIVIGGAFGKIVTSLVNDIIMPPISMLFNTESIGSLKVVLRQAVVDAQGVEQAAAVSLNYGSFIQTIVDFLIIAFCIFLVIKGLNKMRRQKEAEPAAPAEPAEDVKLLTEIRDLLSKK